MTFVEKSEPLWSTLEEIVRDEALALYDLERFGSGQLRVFVTRSDKLDASPLDRSQSGVTSGDCSRVCRRLMVFLAAKGSDFGLTAEPEIDVSSPGINRGLRLPEHFRGAVGERVKIVSRGSAFEGGRTVVGVLCSAEGETVQVKEEGSGAHFSWGLSEIKKASVEFQFGSHRVGAK